MRSDRRKRLLFAVGVALAVIGTASPGECRWTKVAPRPAKVEARPPPPQVVSRLDRTLTLGDLGFPRGLHFEGFSSQQELFFPVPDGLAVQALTLDLSFRSGAAFPSHRSLRIKAGDVSPRCPSARTGAGVRQDPKVHRILPWRQAAFCA